MKTVFTHLKLVLASTALAAWLRMSYPRLTWAYWPRLVGESLGDWIGAILGMPLIEFMYFWWGHVLASVSYFALAQALGQQNARYRPLPWRAAVGLGAAYGAGWYLLLGGLLNTLWRTNEVVLLLPIYTVVGAGYGFLYYRWVSRKQSSNAAQLP